jgi:hypothetical protein
MNNNHNFTLVNFQDHSAYVETYCEGLGRAKVWTHMYLTDVATEGRVVGKAYCCVGAGDGFGSDWANKLRVKEFNDEFPTETSFCLDGTTWYSVWHTWGACDVHMRTSEGSKDWVEVSRGSAMHAEALMAYHRLCDLVKAVAVKAPEKS